MLLDCHLEDYPANEILSVENLTFSFWKIWKKFALGTPFIYSRSWVNGSRQLLPVGCWLTNMNCLVSRGKSPLPVREPWAQTLLLSFCGCVSALISTLDCFGVALWLPTRILELCVGLEILELLCCLKNFKFKISGIYHLKWYKLSLVELRRAG